MTATDNDKGWVGGSDSNAWYNTVVVKRQERAAATVQWLNSLDPSEEQRRELRADGIAEHRIERLYPPDFAAIVPELVKHLRERGTRGLRGLESNLEDVLEKHRMAWGRLESDASQLHYAEYSRSGGVQILVPAREELISQFAQAQLWPGLGTKAIAASTAITLFECWWGMRHLELLSQFQRDSIEYTTQFFADNLLHLP